MPRPSTRAALPFVTGCRVLLVGFVGTVKSGPELAWECGVETTRRSSRSTIEGEAMMKYGIAFLLGVPASVLLVWYLIVHIL
jgi:hypothetical protein